MPYLRSCIESIAAQLPHISKHIVFDGGSTDGSVELLTDLSNKYNHIVWRSEPNREHSGRLNEALNQVDTPFFGWLNADDVYLPRGIESLVSKLSTIDMESAAIVYGDYQRIDVDGKIIAFRRQPSFQYFDCLYGYLTIQHAAAIFNTSLCRLNGGFDESLRFAMDYDLILRVTEKGVVHHVPKYVSAFRYHDESKTTTLDEVCRNETTHLRMRYSARGRPLLLILEIVSKARVLARMTTEGAIWCRAVGTRFGRNF